jgi:hypothetical protein
MYLHSWEFDAGQPRVKGAGPTRAARHYVNLSRTLPRMRQLISILQRRGAHFMTARALVDAVRPAAAPARGGQPALRPREG